MPQVDFHIAIEGPPLITFTSFPNTDFDDGDANKITLAMIRAKCQISKKLYFIIDSNSRVGESTTLAYYMSLTAAGRDILGSKKGDGADNGAAPGISTFKVKVAEKAATVPTTHITREEALAQLKGGIEKDQLPTPADWQLAALAASYSAQASIQSMPEPSELTEYQWQSVLSNNRAFHGYWHDFETGALVKASKPAFRLSRSGSSSTEDDQQQWEEEESAEVQYVPPIPPFYVADDANVTVTEVRSQRQRTWINEGFNSIAVGGSIGGGQTSVPVSVEASFEREQAWANQKHEETDVDALSVTYNFPRAVVELDTDCLELTEECRREAMAVTDETGKIRFFRKYGTIFVTSLTLGGYLHSTRSVSSTQHSTLEQFKDTTRVAAGLSVQTPWAGGGVSYAKISSEGSQESQGSLLQESRLTWDAHGGDTLLCSNPPAWVNTVKDHRLWRLMNQQRIVSLQYLIQNVDIAAWSRLDHPSGRSNVNKRVVIDEEFAAEVRERLSRAFQSEDNVFAKIVQRYYEGSKKRSGIRIEDYNQWWKDNFKYESSGIINEGTLFGSLSLDQKTSLGLFLTDKGILKWSDEL